MASTTAAATPALVASGTSHLLSRRRRRSARRWCRGRSRPGGGDVVGDHQVGALGRQLFQGVTPQCARADPDRWSRPRSPRSPARRGESRPARMSGVGSRTISGAPGLLELLGRRLLGRKSATAAAMTMTSASPGASHHRLFHVRRRLDRDHWTPAGPGSETVLMRSPRRRAGPLVGHRVALLARRAVADVTHRIDRLPGPAGCDDGLTPCSPRRLRQPCGARARRGARIRSDDSADPPAARADVPAGQALAGRLDHGHARRTQRIAMFSTHRGCSHISVCMAGQTSTGARVASRVAVSGPRLPAGGSCRPNGRWPVPPARPPGPTGYAVWVRAHPTASCERVPTPAEKVTARRNGPALVNTGLTHWAPAIAPASGTPLPPCTRRYHRNPEHGPPALEGRAGPAIRRPPPPASLTHPGPRPRRRLKTDLPAAISTSEMDRGLRRHRGDLAGLSTPTLHRAG